MIGTILLICLGLSIINLLYSQHLLHRQHGKSQYDRVWNAMTICYVVVIIAQVFIVLKNMGAL